MSNDSKHLQDYMLNLIKLREDKLVNETIDKIENNKLLIDWHCLLVSAYVRGLHTVISRINYM